MKTATNRRGMTLSGIVIVPVILMTLATTSLWAQPGATASAAEINIDELLPHDTILFFGTDDLMLAAEYARSMPLNKILQEEEVVEFLKKPKEFVMKMLQQLQGMAAQQESMKGVDFDLERFCEAEIGHSFFAITHITLPDVDAPPPISCVPDVGMVFGVEYLNPEHNVMAFLKNVLVTVAKTNGLPLAIQKDSYNGVSFEKLVLPLPIPSLQPCLFKIGNIDVFTTSPKSMKAMIDLNSGARSDSLATQVDFAKGKGYVDFADHAASKGYVNMNDFAALMESAIVHYVTLADKLSNSDADHNLGDEAEQVLEKLDDTKRKMAKVLHNLPQKLATLMDLLGLRSIDGVFSSSLSKNGMATTKTYTTFSGQPKGLCRLCPDIPVTEAKLKMIPKDSVKFSINQFDIPLLYDLIMESVKTFEDEIGVEIDGALKNVLTMLRDSEDDEIIDLRRDLIGTLGTEFISYELKSQGMAMMGAPPIFGFVEMIDFDRFVETLDKILSGLKNIDSKMGSFVALRNVEYEGQKIFFLQFLSLPIPFQPSFAKIDKYLVYGSQTSDIKKLIKNFGKNETTIFDNEDFMSFYAKLPKDKTLLSMKYSNVAKKFGATYEQVAMVLPMLMMSVPADIDLPVDLTLLPTSESITKHLISSLTTHYRDGEGYVQISYGPFGPEMKRLVVPLLATGAATGLFFAESENLIPEGMNIHIGSKDGDEEVVEEVVEEEGLDPTYQAKRDMGSLAGACSVYNILNGQFPDSLEDLLKPTDESPDGCYPSKKLPVDPWGRAYHYKKFAQGKHKCMIWSCGPNGIDEQGEGDDIVKLK